MINKLPLLNCSLCLRIQFKAFKCSIWVDLLAGVPMVSLENGWKWCSHFQNNLELRFCETSVEDLRTLSTEGVKPFNSIYRVHVSRTYETQYTDKTDLLRKKKALDVFSSSSFLFPLATCLRCAVSWFRFLCLNGALFSCGPVEPFLINTRTKTNSNQHQQFARNILSQRFFGAIQKIGIQ